MREILFRGKDKHTGEMVFGTLDNIDEPYLILFRNPHRNNNVETHTVITETVGQYTGLTDKNGRKIFEGDICRFNRFNTVYVGRIVFDINPASFVMWYHSIVGAYGETATHKMLISECVEIEVIGNIHDNPEILKNPNP